MITEGKGQTAPVPVRVEFDRGELFAILAHAVERAKYRGYADRADRWGQGLAPGLEDPDVGAIARGVRPIYCGLLGEWAVCKLIGRRTGLQVHPDLTLLAAGDRGIDIRALLTIQVKTRQADRVYSRVRVDFRDFVPLLRRCDVHAFCEWTGGRTVDVLGWIRTRDLAGRAIVPGRGDWMNVEPADADLLPAARLMDEIRTLMEARRWR